jgi:hypothetical protein
MSGFVAVLRREIDARRVLFLAAAVASVTTFLAPVLWPVRGSTAAETRTLVGLALSAIFLFGVPALIGATALPRAIADRRVSFDFARPISAASIWSGTFVAAFVLGVLSAAIVWIPTAIAGDRMFWPDLVVGVWATEFPWPVMVLGAAAATFGVCQAASIALRSRSALLILDLLIFIASVFSAEAAYARLADGHGPDPLRWGVTAMGAMAAVAVLAGGVVAVAVGRTDIRRAHRAQFVVVWGSIALGLVGVHAWATWILRSAGR